MAVAEGDDRRFSPRQLEMKRGLVVRPVGRPPADFSGTWKLDPAGSRISGAAGLAGLIAALAPDRLHITQPANGTLVIESQINESHVRIYTPGGRSSTPVYVGPPGSITMTSRQEGGALVSEGIRESTSGKRNWLR